MRRSRMILAGLVTALVAAGGAPVSSAETAATKAATKIAEEDFGRLSSEGMSAFEDIHLARLAIFDGQTEEAAKLIADAQSSLAKAKTDGVTFLKAESDLHPPAPTKSALIKGSAPLIWVPIDSVIAVGEGFTATPEKATALVTARKVLAKGEGATALKTIALAEVDVNYTLALAPLDQSIADLDEAARLATGKDFYGASQALRRAEAGIRYDEIDDVANVRSRAKTANKSPQ